MSGMRIDGVLDQEYGEQPQANNRIAPQGSSRRVHPHLVVIYLPVFWGG